MSQDGEVQIKKMELGVFGTNGYLVTCTQTMESIIIDTPDEEEKILAEAKGTRVKYILITHTHMDHLGALKEVRAKAGAPLGVHPLERGIPSSSVDLALNDGDLLRFGKLSLMVLHTPGHTPGSVCFLVGKHLFSGDTLFPGGPGKTGSPADLAQIIKSITEKLFVLPDDTPVYPGHGLNTVLRKEKEELSIFSSRQHDPGLCGDVLWLSS